MLVSTLAPKQSVDWKDHVPLKRASAPVLAMLTAVLRLRTIRSHSPRSPSSITNNPLATGIPPLYIYGKCMLLIYDTVY